MLLNLGDVKLKKSNLKLSVVIASRGDFYGGDQVIKVTKLISQLKRKLNRIIPNQFEIVLVDYNFVEDRSFKKLLSAKVQECVRIITVGKDETHSSVSIKNPFIEYHAKNLGIQSAFGSQILVVNTDLTISTSLLKACIDRPSLTESYLRSDRTDFLWGKRSLIPKLTLQVRNGMRESDSLSSRFPSKGFFQGSPAFPGEILAKRFVVAPPGGLRDHFLGGAHGNAAGDFLCAPKFAWDEIRGYREDKYISSMGDSYILSGFLGLGLKQVIAKGSLRLIHRDHPRPIDYRGDWTQEDWVNFMKEFKSIQLNETPYPTLNRTWENREG